MECPPLFVLQIPNFSAVTFKILKLVPTDMAKNSNLKTSNITDYWLPHRMGYTFIPCYISITDSWLPHRMGYTFIPCYISTISKPFSAIQRAAPHPLSTLSNARSFVKISQGGKALRVLDLIIPKPIKPEVSPNHLRLIQACMQDLVEENANPSSSISTPDVFVEMLDREVCSSSLFFQMHKQGMKADASTLSCALSSCGSVLSIKHGVQLHCLAVKTGFDWYVYVGSSLISLYGKCGKLEEAYRVFEEMPVRNVVSWTAIISGYAQHWEVEMCLELYGRMRFTTSKPNDLTFIGILGACTGSGALEQGRNAHCQIIQMGFDSCIHIANALVSMYSKCGNVKDALSIFFNMQKRDLISWNSMITGYAQNGLAKEAINLFKEIGKQGFQPDAVTFLGLLSSCRHAGLVEHGLVFLNSMIKHGVEPELDHYSCIVDLLGRAGMLNAAKEFIEKMPICPNAVIWGSLLSSCRLHGHVWIGIEAAENRLLLDPSCAATHVQLVNLYASAGHWEQTARVRKQMKDRGLKTNPGYSWIEIKNDVYRFRAEDGLNSKVDDILAVVENLVDNMRGLGYVPEMQDKGFDL